MCVTNNVRRAPRSLAVANPSAMISKTPSLLSQRLVGNFMPMMMNTTNSSGLPLHMAGAMQTAPQQVKPESKKPRRRRKPQKPGKTAKQNERHFVVHNYHDHAGDEPENDFQEIPHPRRRGGVSMSFPMKLHAILDQVEADGLAHVISWQPHGRCFVIHQAKEFTDHVMPKYFRQTKLTSFQRQLNLYGFSRLTTGTDNGGYYHELFLRAKLFLAMRMTRTKVKGTKFKAASSPDEEPNFYTMPPVRVTPSSTSDESSGDEETFYGSPSKVASSTNPMLRGRTLIDPPMLEPIPIFSQTAVQPDLRTFAPQVIPTVASSSNDNAFDAAVNEIFYDEDLAMIENDFNNIWDPSMEVTEKIEDDEQLGFLLEQILHEGV